MKKLIPCMLAGLIITGFFALCITSFLAPSANYILDTLEPTEEPFYFVDNPDSVDIYSGDYLFLSASTNYPDCVYSWEFRLISNNRWRSFTDGTSSDGFLYFLDYFNSNYADRMVFRCKAVYNDMTVYSAPCFVFKSRFSPSKSEKSTEFEELEKSENFEELEKSEVFEDPEDLEESEVLE